MEHLELSESMGVPYLKMLDNTKWLARTRVGAGAGAKARIRVEPELSWC